MKHPRSLYQISRKSAPKGRHIYVYQVNVRTPLELWVSEKLCADSIIQKQVRFSHKCFSASSYSPGEGGTDLERGYGDVRLWRLPFHASPVVCKGPNSSKSVSSQDPPFWENLENLASTASIFAQVLALKPPNWEIFSSQALKFGNFQFTRPLFQRQTSVRKPYTSEIRAAHTYLKKGWVPPPPVTYPQEPLHTFIQTVNFSNVTHPYFLFLAFLFLYWQTAEYAQTVNDSVIKPTREKVNDGTLFSDLSSGTKSWASKVKYALLKHLGKWLQTCWKGRGVRAQNPHGLGEFSPQYSPCE